MRVKRIVSYLLLAIIPSVVLLVVLEFACRPFLPVLDQSAWGTRPQDEWTSCYRRSVTLGYEPVPGQCGFNDLGLDAGDHPRDKTRQTFRILLLGDSLSEGRPWVDDLRRLGAGGGRRVEVWNGGVTGYDTCAELRVLQEKGWRSNPDLVLLQFCVNDFYRTSSILPLPGGRVRFHVGDNSREVPAWILHSHLLTWLTLSLGLGDEGPRGRDGAASAERCLARMKQEAAARKTPFAVLLFPVLRSTGTGKPTSAEATFLAHERKAGEICRSLGINCFRLRPGLERAVSLTTIRQMPNDLWHLSIRGQQIAGQLVTGFVRRRFLGGGEGKD